MECSFLSTNWELIIGLIWVVLKPIAFCLGKIAEKTENKWDNRIVKTISYFGWFIGQFGIGDTPKSIKHKPKLRND